MSSRRDFLPGSKSSGSGPASAMPGWAAGMHLSPKRGSSLEFNDYRHYSPGDDFRYIDWGLYGRSDKLYIKLFQEEEDLLTYIFVDASASMGYPAADRKFESAMLTALALAYVALASGDRVMLRVLGGTGAKHQSVVRHRAPSNRRARAAPARSQAGWAVRLRNFAGDRAAGDSARRQGVYRFRFPDAAQLGHARARDVHRGLDGSDGRADSRRARTQRPGTRRRCRGGRFGIGRAAARLDRRARTHSNIARR